jgi:hypothetical protein
MQVWIIDEKQIRNGKPSSVNSEQKNILAKQKKKLFETELNILAELQNSITEPRKNQDGS